MWLLVALPLALAQGIRNCSCPPMRGVGGSCEQALLRLELVEHLARITLAAAPLGGPRPLDPSVVKQLSAKGRPQSSPCFGALPESRRPDAASAVRPVSRPDVSTLVQDALRRFQ